MTKSLISGFYGHPNGKSEEGKVCVTYISRGISGTLSIAFEGKYQVDIVYWRILGMIDAVRTEHIFFSSASRTIEKSMTVEGFGTDAISGRQKGPVTVWFRKNGVIEMLSLAFEERGQISIPFAPIEKIIRAENSNLA